MQVHTLTPTPAEWMRMDALVSACVLVAQADGWVTREERRRFAERLRRRPAAQPFGPLKVIEAFEVRVCEFELDIDAGERAAEAAIGRLRPDRDEALRLIQAAADMAAADGGHDAEERGVLLRLCELLEIDPGELDLLAPPRRPLAASGRSP